MSSGEFNFRLRLREGTVISPTVGVGGVEVTEFCFRFVTCGSEIESPTTDFGKGVIEVKAGITAARGPSKLTTVDGSVDGCEKEGHFLFSTLTTRFVKAAMSLEALVDLVLQEFANLPNSTCLDSRSLILS